MGQREVVLVEGGETVWMGRSDVDEMGGVGLRLVLEVRGGGYEGVVVAPAELAAESESETVLVVVA